MKNILLLGLLLVVVGCSTMTPPRYSVSMDNNQALKLYAGATVKVNSMVAAGAFDANCRLMGPIEAADGMTIPQFVQKAFNDELKFTGIHSDAGAALDGVLTKISFSSTTGLTNGVWTLGLRLTSSTGKSLQLENSYQFRSGFDAVTACNQTAQTLTPAVQDLIQKTVTNPGFAGLLR